MIERVGQWLRDASHVVVFTGAGFSAESGIPTFRDALTRLWARFDPVALATAKAFRNDPPWCGAGMSGGVRKCWRPCPMLRIGLLRSSLAWYPN